MSKVARERGGRGEEMAEEVRGRIRGGLYTLFAGAAGGRIWSGARESIDGAWRFFE